MELAGILDGIVSNLKHEKVVLSPFSGVGSISDIIN